MNVFSETLREFARRLGLPPAAAPTGDVAEFDIERLGRLQLEEAEGRALVTLARPFAANRQHGATAALQIAHWRENHPWPLTAGLVGDEWLTLTLAIPLEHFDIPVLEQTLTRLGRLHDRVEEEG